MFYRFENLDKDVIKFWEKGCTRKFFELWRVYRHELSQNDLMVKYNRLRFYPNSLKVAEVGDFNPRDYDENSKVHLHYASPPFTNIVKSLLRKARNGKEKEEIIRARNEAMSRFFNKDIEDEVFKAISNLVKQRNANYQAKDLSCQSQKTPAPIESVLDKKIISNSKSSADTEKDLSKKPEQAEITLISAKNDASKVNPADPIIDSGDIHSIPSADVGETTNYPNVSDKQATYHDIGKSLFNDLPVVNVENSTPYTHTVYHVYSDEYDTSFFPENTKTNLMEIFLIPSDSNTLPLVDDVSWSEYQNIQSNKKNEESLLTYYLRFFSTDTDKNVDDQKTSTATQMSSEAIATQQKIETNYSRKFFKRSLMEAFLEDTQSLPLANENGQSVPSLNKKTKFTHHEEDDGLVYNSYEI